MKEYHRHSIRLKGYDYSQSGAYFITINTLNREPVFGEIVDGIMYVNKFGGIVCECWKSIREHFANVELDEFVAMPDHVHGILFILDDDHEMKYSVGATHASPRHNAIPRSTQSNVTPMLESSSRYGPKPQSVGSIVGSFKSAVTNRINKLRGEPGIPLWQRNYYEHIIRNDCELNRIRQYIHDNPAKWISHGGEGQSPA